MRVPRAVRVAQIILYIQCALSIVGGVALILIGVLVHHWWRHHLFQGVRVHSDVIGVITGVLVGFGLFCIIVALLMIWPTILLGRFSSAARIIVTVVTGLGILIDVLSLNRATIAGIVWLVADGGIIYCLWIDGAARRAFEHRPPNVIEAPPSNWGSS
jgi:hypothetical protein